MPELILIRENIHHYTSVRKKCMKNYTFNFEIYLLIEELVTFKYYKKQPPNRTFLKVVWQYLKRSLIESHELIPE